MRCLSPRGSCSTRRKAPRALSGKARKLRRREHGTPGHKALPLGSSRALRPSVQLPAGIERKPGLYGISAKTQRLSRWVGAANLRPSPALVGRALEERAQTVGIRPDDRVELIGPADPRLDAQLVEALPNVGEGQYGPDVPVKALD